MAQDLPQEMLDLVVEKLQLDDSVERNTIAHCGLVCKSWLPSSRYRLFANVRLDDRTIDSFLDAVNSSSFPLISYIRSLVLYSELESGPNRLDELGPLPRVTILGVTMERSALAQNTRRLAEFLPNLSTLSLRDCQLPLRCVLNTVSAFPSLKILELRRVHLSYGLLPFPSTYKFPPQWHALKLDQPDPGRLFEAMLALDTIPMFSSLTVHGMYPREDNSFGAYLRHVGDKMRHIRLETDLSFSDLVVDPAALRYSTGLHRLDLALSHPIDIARWVLRVLPHLHSNVLTTLNIIDFYGVDAAPHHTWEQLDQALADERLVSLNELIVDSVSQPLVAQLAERMPLSVARGILRVARTPSLSIVE
ncbi:hypothetical protein B0H11DRAFT_1960809 [Mycena galericulata]|nr:hypothetical protein B0H11DRAFT_1960809 [Mycena galericulata]